MEFIYRNYFDTAKNLGNRDPQFMIGISGLLMFLIFATLQHALQAYKTEEFRDVDFFNYAKSGGEYKICKVQLKEPIIL